MKIKYRSNIDTHTSLYERVSTLVSNLPILFIVVELKPDLKPKRLSFCSRDDLFLISEVATLIIRNTVGIRELLMFFYNEMK